MPGHFFCGTCSMNMPVSSGLPRTDASATLVSTQTDAGDRMPHDTDLIDIICVGLVVAFVLGVLANRLQAVAAGRLSARGHGRRAVHPGLRRRPGPGHAAGRNRRDAADVRRRPALLAGGPDGGQGDRHSRRDRADRGGHRCWAGRWPGPWAGRTVQGFVFGLALSVASTVVLLRAMEERRLLDTTPRQDRGGLADRRGPGDGAGAGAAAGAGRRPSATAPPATSRRTLRQHRRWPSAWTLLKVGAFVAVMLVVGGG